MRALSSYRLRIRGFALYVEPRDMWVGAYVATTAVYVCPIPFIVLRWTRGGAR